MVWRRGNRMLAAVVMVMSVTVPALAAESRTSVESLAPRLDEGLGLTPEQRNRVRAVREEYKAVQQALREDLSRQNEALRAAMDADNADRSTVDALAAQIKEIQGRLVENRVDVVFKLRGIYTPAQVKLIKERLQVRSKEDMVRKPGKIKPKKIKKPDLKK